MSVIEFTTMTTASMYMTLCHLTACVWLDWTMALHSESVKSGVKLQWTT